MHGQHKADRTPLPYKPPGIYIEFEAPRWDHKHIPVWKVWYSCDGKDHYWNVSGPVEPQTYAGPTRYKQSLKPAPFDGCVFPGAVISVDYFPEVNVPDLRMVVWGPLPFNQ